MLKLHKMLFPTHHIGEMSALEETVCGTEFEKMNTLIHYGWAQNGTIPMAGNWAMSSETTYALALWPRNPTPRNLP